MKRMTTKNKMIAKSIINGKAIKKVCLETGLSKQRVHVIVRDYCLPFLFVSQRIQAKKEKWSTKKIAMTVRKIIEGRGLMP